MQEWELPTDQWPRMSNSIRKVADDTCLEVTVRLAHEPDFPEVKALIEPVLATRFKAPEYRLQIPSTKENLFWVVSVNGQRLCDSDRGWRTLQGAIREAELYLAFQLAGEWQNYLTKQFARDALADFEYQPFKDAESA